MSEWIEKELGEIVNITKGKLTNQKDFLADGYMPLINAEAVNNSVNAYSDINGAVLCNKDDVLMLWDGERSGLVTIGHFGVVGSTFAKLKATDEIDSKYLFYFLKDKFGWIQNLRTGTGVPHVPKDLNKILKVKYPKSKNEQKRIAEILSVCDGVIEKTRAAIAKYKAIKTGMLQDLFTRGIDVSTGKLRPAYQTAPHLYKPSPLGFIPLNWEVESLGTLCKEKPTYGINAAAVEFSPNLPAYIRITDIDENGNYSKADKRSVDNPFYENYILKNGDLVFARTGATVGKTYLYNITDGILVFAGFLIKVSPNPAKLNSIFLKYFTETAFYINWVSMMSQRSGQPGINGLEYGNLLIPKPNMDEQNLIAQKLEVVNKKLQTEQNYLQKLESIKQGLMADLLSGKKRVSQAQPNLAAQPV